jgi:hypothetical protein
MKIQTSTEFLTFSDGKCDIYTVSGNKLKDKVMTLCYGSRTVGMKRYYAARAASVEITRLIQVPQQTSITAAHNAVIDGIRYKIEQVQQLNDTNPRATVLTLNYIGVVT